MPYVFASDSGCSGLLGIILIGGACWGFYRLVKAANDGAKKVMQNETVQQAAKFTFWRLLEELLRNSY